ncbi:MAG TPA: Ig-like domain-containing protein [Fimbriimonadaceae bacterium]|nr:Ig-like domain-containing protein [Fimbriimonadaceae bacterium]
MSAASPGTGAIDLTAYPGISVADGRSTMTLTAEVRDGAGQVVPDGTQVVFSTTLGALRESIVTTQNGFARAILVASSIPGEAKVQATVLKFSATATLSVRFVADRSLLSSASEFIEVVAPLAMAYSLEDKILQANGENRGVHLRYRDISIDADDLELVVPNYEVRAKNAKLTMGGKSYEFQSLFMRLNQRKGNGTTMITEDAYAFDRAWYIAVPHKVQRERFGLVDISSSGVTPSNSPIIHQQYQFQDISLAMTIIEAKKAVAYPSKEVDFHRTNVKVGGTSVMKVPLFRASTHPNSPVITEQYVNVSNNDLSINFPYYLDLKPGQTSLLRLRHGNRYGTGVGLSGGTYLDYEFNWNQGADMDGGVSVRGLARNDWGLDFRQFWKPASDTTLAAQINLPAHRSMFANVNLSQGFDGFHANLNASRGQSIAGQRFNNSQYAATVEKEPILLKGVHTRLFLGVQASENSFSSPTSTKTQARLGLRARFIGDMMRLGPGQSLNMSYTVGRYTGSNFRDLVTHDATLSLTTSFRNGIYLQTNYDYVVDGITDFALGHHRLSADAYYSRGAYAVRGFVTKSLDVQRLNANMSLDFRASSLWRFSYGYYLDQYLGDSFLDQTAVIAYRVGFREVGLSYSQRRHRLGIELLGTTFN